jgi:hypothetical protein
MASNTIAPPRTYAEWVSVLEIFKNKTDDENILRVMQKGTVEWQSGVAERFSRKLFESVNYRLNGATDKFQKEMNRANGQERNIIQALLSLRKELNFLAEAIALPAVPEDDRHRYRQLVVSQADSIQRSLEDSAKRDRTGKLSSIVRNHKVNEFQK